MHPIYNLDTYDMDADSGSRVVSYRPTPTRLYRFGERSSSGFTPKIGNTG